MAQRPISNFLLSAALLLLIQLCSPVAVAQPLVTVDDQNASQPFLVGTTVQFLCKFSMDYGKFAIFNPSNVDMLQDTIPRARLTPLLPLAGGDDEGVGIRVTITDGRTEDNGVYRCRWTTQHDREEASFAIEFAGCPYVTITTYHHAGGYEGDIANVTCNRGFSNLTTITQLQCVNQTSGPSKWVGSVYCNASFCLNVGAPSYDLQEGNIGESAVVSCKAGYNLTTMQPPVCILQSNGIAKWTGSVPCNASSCLNVSAPSYDLHQGEFGETAVVSCKAGYNLTTMQPPVCVLQSNGIAKWTGSVPCTAEATCRGRTIFVGPDMKWDNWNNTYNYTEAQASCNRAGGHIVSSRTFYPSVSVGFAETCLTDFFTKAVDAIAPIGFSAQQHIKIQFWLDGCVSSNCHVFQIDNASPKTFWPLDDVKPQYHQFTPAAICQKR